MPRNQPIPLVLWTLTPGPDPEDDQRRLLPLLDSEERARWERFRDARDRWSYAAAHGLCRLSLSASPDSLGPCTTPAGWRFLPGPHGKPEVDPLRSQASARPFSISHTRGLSACARLDALPAPGLAVGVDVEGTHRPLDAQNLADRFFHPMEAQWLRRLPEDAVLGAFMTLWTLKEAVVKALGTGIQQGLETFHVAADPARLVEADAPFGERGHWRLDHWEQGESHTLALALRAPDPEQVRMEHRAFVGVDALLAETGSL
ncbi:4'-phosphopantetheinyl transferase family protein [Rhodospirillum sp. A1_3_36]|uniref:4'-phosphopantetheinyl transferase family protein n=1 Tax=Rhodospirillum sp. A1_3_36 TaxID=3391666 RepID=UPI0039A58EEC